MHSYLFTPFLVAALGSLMLPHLSFAFDTFNATFGSSPAPFQIDVNPGFIAATKLKASLSRYVLDLEQPDFVDGVPKHNASTLRDYWVNELDWKDVQAELNKKFSYSVSFIVRSATKLSA
jgi:Epoxide hydrolase N terminus